MSQSLEEVNKVASSKTAELMKVIKFNDETQNTVFNAYQEYIQRTYTTSETFKNHTNPSNEDVEKANRSLTEKLKSVFSDDEYARYLKYMDTKK
ncbi:MAG: hypothetical protein ABIO60_10400 [Aquaticitalea sp.]